MSYIINFFTIIFDFLHDIISKCGIDSKSGLSYVLAITLLTIIIRGILLPFNIKAAKSSQKMQEIQPEVKRLQDKYKNDPQKQQMELMKLYKEKDVSMTGGCLPSLLPLPILMALYYTFNKITITGSFLWIPNLNEADPYFILPVLSALTTFIPSYLMSKATPQGEGAMNMMPMNIGMSIFMGYFALKFKSILVIYWILGGVIQLITTYFINYRPAKAKQKAEAEIAAAKELEKNKFNNVYTSSNEASKKKKKKNKKKR